uniref:Coenzyme Q6 monooxygenase n=1 Tax=Oncorhynchus kisutch TaxID=8019 RepID=A0A8C7D284_ONCKI
FIKSFKQPTTYALITFDKENLQDEMAYIVENDIIVAALTKQLENLSDQVKVQYKTKVVMYTWPKSHQVAESIPWVQVTLANGQTFQTKLLIGADGPNLMVRQEAEIPTVKWNYDQSAVVAPTENNVAWQRFLPTGPIAMLPVRVYVQNANDLFAVPSFYLTSPFSPLAPLAKYSRERNGYLIYPYYIRHRVLPRRCSDSVYMAGVFSFLCRDAAHRVYPLAGQGANLGFGDVACLTNFKDLGAMQYLLEYEAERQRHNLPMMAAIDLMKRLYSTNAAHVVLLRTFGLQATNTLPAIKEQNMAFASE